MTLPDFPSAQAYALELLEQAVPPHLCYHSLAHTRDEVLPAVEQFALLEGVCGEDLQLLRTAACFHDIGFIEHTSNHELRSARIATEILPRFSFSPAHIHIICGMIMATRIPQSPHTLLQSLLADADLEALGRVGYWPHADILRAELEALGVRLSDEQWYVRELAFLQAHHYWTDAARALRGEEKQRNVETLRQLVAGCEKVAI